MYSNLYFIIYLISYSFVDPSVTRAIVATMKQYFSQSWEKWMMVPMEIRDLLWNKFQVIIYILKIIHMM